MHFGRKRRIKRKDGMFDSHVTLKVVQSISPKLVLTVTESAQSCIRQRMHISGIELINAPFRSCEVKHEKRREHVVQLLGYPEALHVWTMDDDGVCLPVSPVSLVYVQQHCRTSRIIDRGSAAHEAIGLRWQ